MFALKLEGKVVPGYQVASGTGEACEYPGGSLKGQIPYFKKLGIDLAAFFRGTINIDISPLKLKLNSADYVFKGVAWTEQIPPEDFMFSRCVVQFGASDFEGYIYYPSPETKVQHFHNPSIIEVITNKIEGLAYDDAIAIRVQKKHVTFLK